MKFYSEKLDKLFETEEALKSAENAAKVEAAKKELEAKKAKETRATDAKKVETALAEARESSKKANKALEDFVKKYGYFHTSYTLNDTEAKNRYEALMTSGVNAFWNIFNDFLM